jgi:hypothetical protein
VLGAWRRRRRRRSGVSRADFGAPLHEPCPGVVVDAAQVGKHDPCVFCTQLGLGVCLFGLDVQPLDLNDLLREVVVAAMAAQLSAIIFSML